MGTMATYMESIPKRAKRRPPSHMVAKRTRMDIKRNTTRDMTSIPKRAKSLMVAKRTHMDITRDMTSIPKRAKRIPSPMVTKRTSIKDFGQHWIMKNWTWALVVRKPLQLDCQG